jgi:hypothetical protein
MGAERTRLPLNASRYRLWRIGRPNRRHDWLRPFDWERAFWIFNHDALLFLAVAMARLRHTFDDMSRTPLLGNFDGCKTTGVCIATDRKRLAVLRHSKPFFSMNVTVESAQKKMYGHSAWLRYILTSWLRWSHYLSFLEGGFRVQTVPAFCVLRHGT